MPKLLILTHDPKEYLDLIQKAKLPDLEIFTEPNFECDIVFGDTGRLGRQHHYRKNRKMNGAAKIVIGMFGAFVGAGIMNTLGIPVPEALTSRVFWSLWEARSP